MLLITFLQNDYINTTVLPDKKTGHYKLNHSISGLTEDINVDGIDNKWIITSGTQYRVIRYDSNGNGQVLPKTAIESSDVLLIEADNTDCTLIAETISDEKTRFTKFCMKDPNAVDFTIRIGKKKDNDIVLDDSFISGEHAAISKREGLWYVTDRGSRNGTYINNKKMVKGQEMQLAIGDVVFIAGYKFVICADYLAANIDFEKCVRSKSLMQIRFPQFLKPVNGKVSKPVNYFYRTIDLGEEKPDFEEITLLPPERSTKKEDQSILLSMGSAMTMSTASVLVAAYSGIAAYYRGTSISYVVPSFIMAGSMVLSAMFWPTIIRRSRRKTDNKNERARVKDYQDYIMQLRDSVNVMKDTEKRYLSRKYLTADECMKRVIDRDRYLWSKSINDDDFMSVAIGIGTRESAIRVKYTENSDAFFKDSLRYDMMQFANEERVIEDAPITISLNNGCICGINGDPDTAGEMIKEIVVQLTSLYSYDELKLIFICEEENERNWEYAKWLPHVWNSDNTFRYIAFTPDEIKELAYELEKEIDNRTSRSGDDFPKMLIIASDKKLVDSIDIMPVIMKKRKELGFSLLTSFGMYNYNNSDMIIELSETGSKLYDRGSSKVTDFSAYKVSPEFDLYLDMISNIKLDISTEKYQLPKMLTFLDMFRVSKVEHLNSLTRWQQNNPIKSLKTEIGVAPSGDVFFIDMHEKFHGPHGLIAGTTGSGKSESIITVMLSLAVNYSPEEVAFVIVDYKGGGLADAFNDVKEEVIDGKTVETRYKLPHVVGTVTNLDGATIERACISIETELKRRQFLFKKARKISNEGTMDIYKYQQLRREGADLEVLPHLFIVCDEFAELKADRSDFMDLLVSAARIGRSLGIHLILATQKPDSVVSPQIWSNSRFKICLKVQGKDDSRAVIHCPDAAEISTTGRFFFQVGYNEVFSMGQSAWCGADYIESEDFVKNDVESVEVISNTGTVLYEKALKAKQKVSTGKTVSQLIAVRNYLIDIARDIEIRPLWLDPIPAKLSMRALYSEHSSARKTAGFVPLEPIIGKRDDLYNRIQEIMTVPFSKKGNLLIYGAAGSGLDMFFISLIYSLIYGYSPNQVNIYVLDFDAGFLKTFDKAPHVGDVVTAEDDDDVKRIIEAVRDEISRRSKLFSEYRGEYEEYCKHSGDTSVPNIVLMLNNYTEFIEKFDSGEAATLAYIAREGVKRGIFLVVGTSSINMNFRMRQYIQQTFMLKMNDVNDYIGVLGRTGGITPSDCPGSGIVKEDDITYKFQTADIFDIIPHDDDDENIPEPDAGKEIRELCAEAAAKFSDIKAPSYRDHEADPETVPEIVAPGAGNLPLGTDGSKVIYYDISNKYTTFISAKSHDTMTPFIRYIARTLSTDESVSVVVLDPSGELKAEDGKFKCYTTVDEFNEWNKEYKAEAERRCGLLFKDSDGRIKLRGEEKHVYVIINSFERSSMIADLNVTFNNLKLIINELPEINYHYIICDTPEMMFADRGAYIHIVKNVEDVSDIANLDTENNREWFDDSGIWLGDGLSTQQLFELTGRADQPVSNEGVIIRNKKTEKRFRFFK